MAKADKDGWIRHRGGKCPVEAGVLVDVKLRNGEIFEDQHAMLFTWTHSACRSRDRQIMKYRLHKPAEQPCPVETKAAERIETLDPAKTVSLEQMEQRFSDPLQWRDRITEIKRTIEELEEERVSLIQRLADEGLQLLQAKACGEVKPVEDWQASAVTEGKYIQAIKEHRKLYGSGLKEAKRAVDAYRDAHRPSA